MFPFRQERCCPKNSIKALVMTHGYVEVLMNCIEKAFPNTAKQLTPQTYEKLIPNTDN